MCCGHLKSVTSHTLSQLSEHITHMLDTQDRFEDGSISTRDTTGQPLAATLKGIQI